MAGVGQYRYREWQSNIRQDAKELGAFALDSIESVGDLREHFEQFYNDLVETWDEEELPNRQLWLGRAQQEVNRIVDKLRNKYNIPEDEDQDTDEDNETYNDERDGTILGFQVVTKDNKPLLIAAGVERRQQIYPTLGDLESGIEGIPRAAIHGVEVKYSSNGKVLGYYIWVGGTD